MPGLASAAGAVITSGINAASQAVTNSINREQARDAFKAQRDEVRRQNEYNSPSMQVARLMQAGLSPSLAYGANGEVVGNQSDLPEYTPIPAEAPTFADPMQGYREGIATELSIQEQENSNARTMADLAFRDAETFETMTQGHLNEATKRAMEAKLPYEINEMAATTSFMSMNEEKLKHEVASIDQQIAESKKRMDLTDAQIAEINQLGSLYGVQAYEIMCMLPHRVQNMDANTALQWMQTSEAQETIQEIYQRCQTLGFERALASQKFDWEKTTWKNEQDKWLAEQKNANLRWMGSEILGLGKTIIGASLISRGAGSASPIYSRSAPVFHGAAYVHHGDNTTKPKTNSAGVSLGRGYRR